MGKRANKALQKLLRSNLNLPKKVIRKKFEKQYTIERRQWFQKSLHEQRNNFRLHFKKVLKDKKDIKVQLECIEDTKVWRPTRHEDTKNQEKLERNVVLEAGLLNAEGIDRPWQREELAKNGKRLNPT